LNHQGADGAAQKRGRPTQRDIFFRDQIFPRKAGIFGRVGGVVESPSASLHTAGFRAWLQALPPALGDAR
jgi:hypothetical protein